MTLANSIHSLPSTATVLGPAQYHQPHHPQQPQQQQPQRPRRFIIFIILLLFGLVLLGKQFTTPPLVANALREASTSNALASYLFQQRPQPQSQSQSQSLDTQQQVTKDDTTTTTSTSTSTSIPTDQDKDKDQDEDQSIKDQQEEDKEDQKLILDQEKQQDQQPLTTTATTTVITTSVASDGEWKPPTKLSTFEPVHRSTRADSIVTHPWTVPRVLHWYARPTSPDTTDVFVYTTGVHMGNFKARHLKVYGCLVDNVVYILSKLPTHNMDVFICQVPSVKSFRKVSVVLHDDDALQEAMINPLPPPLSTKIELNKDVYRLGSDVRIHDSEDQVVKLEKLLMVASHATHEEKEADENRKNNQQLLFDVQKGLELTHVARYEICAVTMMKQFSNLLPDWLAYHRRLGIDMFYIFDNDSPDDFNHSLNLTTTHQHDVDVIYWPYERSQVQAMSYLAVAARARCEWLISFDADEYIMLPLGRDNEYRSRAPLKLFLSMMRVAGYDDVRFKYITMGPSGNTYVPPPTLPVPEAYICKWFSQKLNVKSASQTSRPWLISKIHYQKGAFHPSSKLIKGKVNDTPIEFNSDAFKDGKGTPALVHFQFRSLEESMLKKKFGSSSIGDKNAAVAEEDKKETRSLLNPAKEYREIIEKFKYTFFRDVWRNVTNALPDVDNIGQTLVRWKPVDGSNGAMLKRCIVKWMAKDGRTDERIGEVCTEDKDQGVGQKELAIRKIQEKAKLSSK